MESLALKIRRGLVQMSLGSHPRAVEWLAAHAAELLRDGISDSSGASDATPVADSSTAATSLLPSDTSHQLPTNLQASSSSSSEVSCAYLLKGFYFYPLKQFRRSAIDNDNHIHTTAAAAAGSSNEGISSRLPMSNTTGSVVSTSSLHPSLLASLPPSIPRRHPCGWWTDDVTQLTREKTDSVTRREAAVDAASAGNATGFTSSRWVILPKPFWLGPLVIPCSLQEAQAMEAGWANASATIDTVADSAAQSSSASSERSTSVTSPDATMLAAHSDAFSRGPSISLGQPSAAAAATGAASSKGGWLFPFQDAFDQCTSAAEKAVLIAKRSGAGRSTRSYASSTSASAANNSITSREGSSEAGSSIALRVEGYAVSSSHAASPSSISASAPFIKFAAAGSGLHHWDGLGRNALPRVSDGRRLEADVAANFAAAVSTATARALRLLIAEVRYDPKWPNAPFPLPAADPASSSTCAASATASAVTPCEGAWVEVSRGFLVEPGWASEDDAAHQARYGPEMRPVGFKGRRAE